MAALLPVAAMLACSGRAGVDSPHPQGDDGPSHGTVPPPVGVSTPEEPAFQALVARANGAAALDVAGAAAAYPTSFRAELGYDPLKSAYLDRIQASALALSDPDRAALAKNGFVVSTAREFPTFMRGLSEIYFEHLPVYVSADAVLEAVHSSYDAILLGIEEAAVIPDVRSLLTGMHARLSSSSATEKARHDADVYLTVALALLDGGRVSPVSGASADEAQALVDAATKAAGQADVELFGVTRSEDFSQFVPRGHYASESRMQGYFRAMMWLGRVDLRLIETRPNGSQEFHRDQFEAMLLLRDLIGPDIDRWQRVDDTLQTFVGPSDYMVVPQVDQLVADLGGPAAAHTATDQAIVQAIAAGGYGKQQIASHIMVNDGTLKQLPLNRSFLVFGQRYIVDSHVFSETVYDRVVQRMMPNPLDVAFAALGNNQALALNPDLSRYAALPGALSRLRVLVDAHDDAFWGANLYNLWLTSLRAMSPNAAPDATSGMPAVALTEAWGRRILNAQLGSWSELRHDTLLYAKQSYTGTPGCNFPDAYVDPYPQVFAAIRRYAEAGARIAAVANTVAPSLGARVSGYFQNLRTAASNLQEMAELERRGEPFTEGQLAFINDAVRIEKESVVCTTIDVPDGWYAKLFFDPSRSIKFDPTIADVHTQPADEAGNVVGHVLHVGTGYPRLMVATVDGCSGPRAYAGVVYAYHEETTSRFERLTDESWAARFKGGPRPAEVAWMRNVLTPAAP